MTCVSGEDKVINKDWACRSGIEMRKNCINWNELHKPLLLEKAPQKSELTIVQSIKW